MSEWADYIAVHEDDNGNRRQIRARELTGENLQETLELVGGEMLGEYTIKWPWNQASIGYYMIHTEEAGYQSLPPDLFDDVYEGIPEAVGIEGDGPVPPVERP